LYLAGFFAEYGQPMQSVGANIEIQSQDSKTQKQFFHFEWQLEWTCWKCDQ